MIVDDIFLGPASTLPARRLLDTILNLHSKDLTAAGESPCSLTTHAVLPGIENEQIYTPLLLTVLQQAQQETCASSHHSCSPNK